MVRPMYRAMIFPTLLALSACASPPSTPIGTGSEPILVTPDRPVGAATKCQANQFQRLVGLSHDDLLRVRILGPVRVIRPGTAVTMDFVENRLNIELDETETVTRVYCG